MTTINFEEYYLFDTDAILSLADDFFEYNDYGYWNVSTDALYDFVSMIEQAYIKKYELNK
jgi:hypothetical protein